MHGEIDYHQELHCQLNDVHFVGYSDTETILHLLSRFDIAGIPV